MTDAPDMATGPEDRDALAAEYALGVLEGAERAAAERLAARDAAFARAVDVWTARLSGMNAAYDPKTPPAWVKRAIDRRLFPERGPAPFWERLSVWRIATAASLAAAVALGALALRPGAPGFEPDYAASLASESGPTRFLALYDVETRRLRVTRTGGGGPEAGRSHELWLIEEGAAPASLGLLEARPDIPVGAGAAQALSSGAALAVSVEPAGGSPTGGPTGPVIAVGAVGRI